MRKIDLDGEWSAKKTGERKASPVSVPGRFRENGAFSFDRAFAMDDASAFDAVFLVFSRLRSPAEIVLNGKNLGESHGGEGICEFDAKDALKPGRNILSLRFAEKADIIGNVALFCHTGARIKSAAIEQDPEASLLRIRAHCESFAEGKGRELLARLCHKGNILAEKRLALSGDFAEIELAAKNVQHWWPLGLGSQPLYEVTVDILQGRSVLDHLSRRIGFRTFSFAVEGNRAKCSFNGRPFFPKGAVWTVSGEEAERKGRLGYTGIIRSLAAANVNTLRIPAERGFECEDFYDLCDEYGICILQEETGVSAPEHSSLLAKRLEYHPGFIGVSGKDIPVSAFSAGLSGTEELPQSFPRPQITLNCLEPEARHVNHPACMALCKTPGAMQKICASFFDNFIMPSSFEQAVWLSQIQHGVLLKEHYERMRLSEEEQNGFFIPAAACTLPSVSHSTLDPDDRWKAAHYILRRSFSPVSCIAGFDAQTTSVRICAMNDTPQQLRGIVEWKLWTFSGEIAAEGSRRIAAAPNDRATFSLKLKDAFKKHGAQNLILFHRLFSEGGPQLCWNCLGFLPWRDLATQSPQLRVEMRAWDENSWAVTLSARTPALWTWIYLAGIDARFDDNFFCIEPSHPVRVRILASQKLKLEQLRQALRIGTLRDTYRPPSAPRRQA